MQWLRAGQIEPALSNSRAVLADRQANPEACYNAACVLAQAVPLDPAHAAERAAMAMALLRTAAAKGYFKIPGRLASFDGDPDMAPIREYREFGEFRAGLAP